MTSTTDRETDTPRSTRGAAAYVPKRLDARRDIGRLLHLAAIADYRSLSTAAVMLGVTQPALTKSIQSLEASLGAPVLRRGRGGAEPTALGSALIARVQAIQAELRAAHQDIVAAQRRGRGEVVIGCGPSEATRLLPLALSMLGERYRQLAVTVHYGLNEALMPMVKSGEIEFALSSIPSTARDPELGHETLDVDFAAVVARAGHPLSERGRLRPADFAGAAWILARRSELERRAFDDMFLNAGLPPVEAEIETTSAVLMKTMAMTSDFLTFLPRELIGWEERAGQLCVLPVAAPPWHRHFGITRRRKTRLGAGASVVADAIRTAAEQLRRASKGRTAR